MNKPDRLMNKEWVPENPCVTCGMKDLNDCDYPEEHCERKYIQKVKANAQKKLLEYLIVHGKGAWLDETPRIYKDELESMLKQLEEPKC